MKHRDRYNILTDCQHNFRRRKSYETQLVTLLYDLASSLDKGIQTYMVVLDFSKAFDRVNQRLMWKFHHYGIRDSTHRWVTSFLTGRAQRVFVEGFSSGSVPDVSGAPQGSILGLLLFLLFINNLPDKITSNTRHFADDCIIYRQINDTEDCIFLQDDLHALAKWESNWDMAFHPQKCNVLNISRSRSPINFSFHLKGYVLELQEPTKYLGVDLQSSLSWKIHIDKANIS